MCIFATHQRESESACTGAAMKNSSTFSVMQGVRACRNQPLLHTVPRVDLLALANSGRWNALPVPSVDVVMVLVMLIILVMMLMMMVMVVMMN